MAWGPALALPAHCCSQSWAALQTATVGVSGQEESSLETHVGAQADRMLDSLGSDATPHIQTFREIRKKCGCTACNAMHTVWLRRCISLLAMCLGAMGRLGTLLAATSALLLLQCGIAEALAWRLFAGR